MIRDICGGVHVYETLVSLTESTLSAAGRSSNITLFNHQLLTMIAEPLLLMDLLNSTAAI